MIPPEPPQCCPPFQTSTHRPAVNGDYDAERSEITEIADCDRRELDRDMDCGHKNSRHYSYMFYFLIAPSSRTGKGEAGSSVVVRPEATK